ncbi:MAG: glycoside hydrolase [Ignavibacteriae bacterium]|nr:glycoside hydrolase [Ignavibacteriota bacterium]
MTLKILNLMTKMIILILLIKSISIAQNQKKISNFGELSLILNVLDYGAIGDGIQLNTKAFQKAINDCSISGGKIIIPPGKYLTGSLTIKSNVTIEILNGAAILGSTKLTDYEEHIPELQSYNDVFLRYSLFYAEKAENIKISGDGTIDGQGSSFIRTTKEKPQRYMNRPYVIRFVECKNVSIENINMQNSAMWMQQYLACEYLTIRGIKVYNHANYNNDMMDIDGCKNVIISDCFGDTDDDGITLKSTSNRITENVTITNCVVSSHCNAIKLGTESIGGFKNITISNIVVKPSESKTKITGYHAGISGITLGMVDGGILDGVMINNIIIDGPQVPIFLRLGNRGRTIRDDMQKPNVGVFQNVNISNIIASNTGQFGCSVTGLENYPIKNISLSNISIHYKGGITEEISLVVPELENEYPESNMFGILPSYGFYFRNIENLKLDNIDFRLTEKDTRYSMIFKGINILTLKNILINNNYSEKGVVLFDKVMRTNLENPKINYGSSKYFDYMNVD